jgi:dethiobiotin synthetase
VPDAIWVVAGTATEVGKTWVAARLAEGLKHRGHTVACRKPVQSFEPGGGPTDADVLAAASGEEVDEVCPPNRSYEKALAPPMAAEALGRDLIALSELVDELSLPEHGIVLIEGVGGPRSPLAHDGDTVLLAWLLRSPVVLVAHPGLGTINDIRLARDAFAPLPVAAFLNRFDEKDDLHRANRTWLQDRVGAAVFTTIDDLLDAMTQGSNDDMPVEAQ